MTSEMRRSPLETTAPRLRPSELVRESVRQNPPSAVLVLGMHRSGTSAAAGMLCHAGAWAGDAEHLMQPDEFNPVGYFERVDISLALDGLLEDLGGSWDRPPIDRLNAWELERIRPRLAELFLQIRESSPEGRVPLLKDPRLCLFSSQMISVMGGDVAVVVCARHPIDVARSLQHRNGIPLRHGLALWEVYNASICSGLAGRAAHVFSVDRLSLDPSASAAFVEHTLGTSYLSEDSSQLAVCHLRGELLHHKATPAEGRAWLTVPQALLWESLRDASEIDGSIDLPTVPCSPSAIDELQRGDPGQRSSRLPGGRTAAWGGGDAHSELGRQQPEPADPVGADVEAQVADLLTELRTRNAELAELKMELASTVHELTRSQMAADNGISERNTAARFAELQRLEVQLAASREQNHRLATSQERAARHVAQELEQLQGERDEAVEELRLAMVQLTTAIAMNERFAHQLTAEAADLEVALEGWEAAEDELVRLRSVTAEAEERTAGTIASLVRDLDAAQGFISSVQSLRLECGPGQGAVPEPELLDWILQLSTGQPVEVNSRTLADIATVMAELDASIGFIEAVRSRYALSCPDEPATDLDHDALLRWLDAIRDGITAVPVIDDRRGGEELQVLRCELEAVRAHRDEVVEQLLAVCGSESWRLGYALTWPARMVSRGFRRRSREARPSGAATSGDQNLG